VDHFSAEEYKERNME